MQIANESWEQYYKVLKSAGKCKVIISNTC